MPSRLSVQKQKDCEGIFMRRKVQKTKSKTDKHNSTGKNFFLLPADKVTLSRILMSAYKYGQLSEWEKFFKK